MDQKALGEFYKKNKVVTWGLIFLVFVLLVNTFFFKPRFKAHKEEALGPQAEVVQVAQKPVSPADSKAVSQPLVMPEPLPILNLPNLSPDFYLRFEEFQEYPFKDARNFFRPVMLNLPAETSKKTATLDVISKKLFTPPFTYHGFFSLDNDKIAIIRTNNDLLMTKVGAMLRHTSYRLLSASTELIEIIDIDNNNFPYVIMLSRENIKE